MQTGAESLIHFRLRPVWTSCAGPIGQEKIADALNSAVQKSTLGWSPLRSGQGLAPAPEPRRTPRQACARRTTICNRKTAVEPYFEFRLSTFSATQPSRWEWPVRTSGTPVRQSRDAECRHSQVEAESEELLGRLTFLDIRSDMSVVSEMPSGPHLSTVPRRSSATAIPTRSVPISSGREWR